MKIERRIMPAHAFEKEYSFWNVKLAKAVVKFRGTYVDPVDREALKINMIFYNNPDGRNVYEDYTYNIKDKMLEVFELHTDHTISIRANGVYHGTYMHGTPMQKMMYYNIGYRKNPGVNKGMGMGYMIDPLQEVYDALLNMRIDNVKLTMNKMFFVDSSISAFGPNNQNGDQTMRIAPGKIMKVKDPQNTIKEMEVSEMKQSGYTEVDGLYSMVQALTGTSSQVLGQQQKVERTPAGVGLLRDAEAASIRPLLASVSQIMAKIMKDICVLSLVNMDKKTIERIAGVDTGFEELKPMDIIKDFDFSFEMISQASQQQEIKAQQIMGMIQLAQKLQDSAGMPILDARQLSVEWLKTQNLDFNSALLTPEKILEYLQQKQKVDQQSQQQQSQA